MTNNDHSIYTAEDIAKYLSGKLSPAQMHAMEKEALDDPFLAEAMEGYEGINENDWQAQLAAAKLQLQENENSAKVVPLYAKPKNNWWKAVAAILVIGGLATLTYKLTNNKVEQTPEENIAKVTPPLVNNIDTPAIVTDPVETKNNPVTIIKPTDTKTNGTLATTTTTVTVPANSNYYTVTEKGDISKNSDDVKEKPSRADSNFIYTPSPATKDFVKTNSNAALISETDKFKSGDSNRYFLESYSNTNVAPSNNAAVQINGYGVKKKENIGEVAAVTRKQAAPLNYNRSFLAQVVSSDNTPLPFANITIKSENFGTYADVKGNFRLVSTDSLVLVEVRSVGFLPKVYTLTSGAAQNKITLSEDVSAFAKTVIKENNTGKASRRATLLKDSSINVEPADGWENYNTYVSNNIDIPEDILKRDLHGEMEISFNIQSNGAITNVQVDKNGCDNCDEAAVKKLIEQGPQWKLKKGKSGKARIKVKF